MSTVVVTPSNRQYLVAAGGYNDNKEYKDLYVINIDAGAVNISKSDVYVPISSKNNTGFATTVAGNIVVCVGQPAPDANSSNSKGMCMFQVNDDGSVVDISDNVDDSVFINNPYDNSIIWTKSSDNTIVIVCAKNDSAFLYMLTYDTTTKKLTGADATGAVYNIVLSNIALNTVGNYIICTSGSSEAIKVYKQNESTLSFYKIIYFNFGG